MATSQISEVIRHLRKTAMREEKGLTDGELLDRFVRERDDAAIAALVHRHGPMVWGVCRRILSSHHDAEDAFQATFLVLIRRAAAIQHQALLANWLYGVAQQTALRARAWAFKQHARERQVIDMPEPVAVKQELWDSLQPLFDQELSGLPEKYRTLIVLCDLEGKTRKEVAEALECPEGTVAGRLARARTMLAKRLARRGVLVSAGALGTMLSAHAAMASAPSAVISSTIQAASLYAAGHVTTAGVISAKAVVLSEGVLKAMLIAKLKIASVLAAALVVLALGGGAWRQSLASDTSDAPPIIAEDTLALLQQQRPQPPQRGEVTVAGKLESVTAGSVTIAIAKRGEAPTSKAYVLAKDAKIQRDGKDVKLTDLKSGSQATLTLSKDEKSVVRVNQATPAISSPLKSVDADKYTITITVGTRAAKEDKTYPVSKDAKIIIDGKDGKLADLKVGATVAVVLRENTVTLIRSATVRRERNP